MEKIPVTIIRSKRKTLGLQIRNDGTVLARAPLKMPEAEILDFVSQKSGWIRQHQAQLAKAQENVGTQRLTRSDLEKLCQEAMRIIPPKVAHYAKLIGVTYGNITIRNQKTKWGSCSSLGNLNFNCLLMLAPELTLDSVIVHELCHRKHMNHSPEFYAEVLRVFPDYHKHDKWLKDNGAALMRRMTG
jgi:hypothetical protein